MVGLHDLGGLFLPRRRTGTPTRRSCGCGRSGLSSYRRSGAWSSRRSRDGRCQQRHRIPRGGRDGDSSYPPLFSLCVPLAGRAGRGLPARHGEAGEAGAAVTGGSWCWGYRGDSGGSKGDPMSCPTDPGAGGEAGGTGWREGAAGQGGGGSAEPLVLAGGRWGGSWQCRGLGCAGVTPLCTPEREGKHELRHRDTAGRGGRPTGVPR